MAKKDVMEYYDQICEQYKEMCDNLKDMQDGLSQQLISPERFEEFKASLEPLKTNYMRVSYIVFLLNKPNKLQYWIDKNIISKFRETKLKKLEKAYAEEHGQKTIEENKAVIKNMKL